MADRRTRTYRAISYAVGASLLLAGLATQLRGRREWLFAAAFYLGGGSIAFLFLQWRRKGSALARNWCLAAFGTWAVAVGAGSAAQTAGLIIAGTALGIGFLGAVHFLLRARRQSS